MELAPMDFLASLVERIPPGRALDAACGAGRHARLLAEHGWDVTAVDASGVGLGLVGDSRVRCVRADLERGGFVIEPGAWDLIVCTCYLQRDLIPAIREGVAEGGRVAMAIPVKGTMNPAFTVEPGELLEWFQGWEVEHWREERLAEIVAVRSNGWNKGLPARASARSKI